MDAAIRAAVHDTQRLTTTTKDELTAALTATTDATADRVDEVENLVALRAREASERSATLEASLHAEIARIDSLRSGGADQTLHTVAQVQVRVWVLISTTFATLGYLTKPINEWYHTPPALRLVVLYSLSLSLSSLSSLSLSHLSLSFSSLISLSLSLSHLSLSF